MVKLNRLTDHDDVWKLPAHITKRFPLQRPANSVQMLSAPLPQGWREPSWRVNRRRLAKPTARVGITGY
jgi:hypothetical protein